MLETTLGYFLLFRQLPTDDEADTVLEALEVSIQLICDAYAHASDAREHAHDSRSLLVMEAQPSFFPLLQTLSR